MPTSPERTTHTQPAFLITIDVEGDNLWSRPKTITTNNSRYLRRFQEVCERYGVIPTYLTNYEMALCPVYTELAQDALRRNTAEVGMHLHAWHSPPAFTLTDDDYQHTPYLIEYPADVLRQKVVFMTELLQETFGRAMTSHRAGRWGLDPAYVRCLIDCGYTVDCSVTPNFSWRDSAGVPGGDGGPDYRHAPEHPYFLSEDDVCRPGNSGLLEVPMTVMQTSPPIVDAIRERVRSFTPLRGVLNRLYPPFTWLRPDGRNGRDIMRLLRRATSDRRTYVEFMLHSSEFMPGGSPTFPDERSIEVLYELLSQIFEVAQRDYRPLSLSDFAAEYLQAGNMTKNDPAHTNR